MATVSLAGGKAAVTLDPEACTLPDIERAILKADLGLMPVNDGKLLRVPIPELTEERRRQFVKQCKKISEDHKLGIRSARRDAISMAKDLENDKEIAEDESHRVQKKIQDLTDEYTRKIDHEAEAKEEEILRI